MKQIIKVTLILAIALPLFMWVVERPTYPSDVPWRTCDGPIPPPHCPLPPL